MPFYFTGISCPQTCVWWWNWISSSASLTAFLWHNAVITMEISWRRTLSGQCQESLSVSLSVCRFDFRLESCWEPKQMEGSKTPTPEFEKSNTRAGISRVCLRRNVSVNAKLRSLHKLQLGGFVLAKRDFLIEDHHLNKKEHYLL